MKKHILATLSLASTLFFAPSAYAGADGWVTDFEAAKKQAIAENKDLLVDFTGSDWCGWCIKLSEEVFSQDEFKKTAPEKFVLVELDFPNDTSKMDEKTIAQNKMLAQQFQIKGYPTILLLDANGLPYAKTGYQAGGPGAYLTHLDELQSIRIGRDAKFAEAAKLTGVEKAKALYAGLMEIPTEQQTAYSAVIEEIIALDPEDSIGLKAQNVATKAFAELETELNAAIQGNDVDAALKAIDSFITTHKPEGQLKQKVLVFRIGPLMEKRDFEATSQTIDEIIAIAPKSEIGMGAASFKKELPKIIEKIKAESAPQKAPEPAAAQ